MEPPRKPRPNQSARPGQTHSGRPGETHSGRPAQSHSGKPGQSHFGQYPPRPRKRRVTVAEVPTCKEAKWSLVLGLLSFVLFLLTAIPSFLLARRGLRKIKESRGRLQGKDLAIYGMLTSIISTVAGFAFVGIYLANSGLLGKSGGDSAGASAQKADEMKKGAGGQSGSQAQIESDKNLRRIGDAFRAYLKANEASYPVARDWMGMDQLSWRVKILPYLGAEEKALYQKFHLAEAWDSPHNKALLSQMPPVYVNPRFQLRDKANGMTYYRGFTGPNTIFGNISPHGLSMGSIASADGGKNTFLVVEAGDPVEWTRGDAELLYDKNKPLPKLGGPNGDSFNALMAFDREDGPLSLTHYPKNTAPEKIRARITWDGSEPIESAGE